MVLGESASSSPETNGKKVGPAGRYRLGLDVLCKRGVAMSAVGLVQSGQLVLPSTRAFGVSTKRLIFARIKLERS